METEPINELATIIGGPATIDGYRCFELPHGKRKSPFCPDHIELVPEGNRSSYEGPARLPCRWGSAAVLASHSGTKIARLVPFLALS
jgi:hypothetical protein